MAQRVLPGIGLTAGWASGDDGWGSAMNTNLIALSAVCQLVAVNIVDTLPTTPADGEIYLLASTASANAGMVAVRDDGSWRFIQPVVGWEAFVANNNAKYRYVGGTWTAIQTAATIPPFSSGVASYNLAVNPLGTGVIWTPPYEPTYEIPLFDNDDIGYQLKVVADGSSSKLAWVAAPLSLPAIPSSSKGKVAVVDSAGTGITYEEDGKYKAVAPGYVVTDDDMSGRVILGATGNVVIPAGLTRTSTLTISRMSTNEVTVSAGAGVVLNVADSRYNLRARYSAVSIVRTAPNTYLMFGDVSS